MTEQQDEAKRENVRLMRKLIVVAVGMFVFGVFILPPFYEKICELTGIRAVIKKSGEPVNTQVDPSRTISVEFDANVRGLPWEFKPMKRSLDVHPGELRTVMYEVRNTLDRPVTGQAIPSFGPQVAGLHFLKMECFCFTQQTLGPGEVRDMPVAFIVAHTLPEDVATITLSYSFFEVKKQ
jgi:cytochrome c oxidase assembly protein subunit 11